MLYPARLINRFCMSDVPLWRKPPMKTMKLPSHGGGDGGGGGPLCITIVAAAAAAATVARDSSAEWPGKGAVAADLDVDRREKKAPIIPCKKCPRCDGGPRKAAQNLSSRIPTVQFRTPGWTVTGL